MKEAGRMVLWKVRCLNRHTRTFFDRDLLLNMARVPSDELTSLLAAVESRNNDSAIVKCRKYFECCDTREVLKKAEQCASMSIISLQEYFEDETGSPLDIIGIAQILSGNPNPIILAEPRSILRLGPSGVHSSATPTQQDANDLAHFIQAVRLIQRGRWWREGVALSSVNGLASPDFDGTVAALALLRQFLMKRDKTFETATGIYVRVVADERKRDWVAHELSAFQSRLLGPAFGILQAQLPRLSAQELIETFIYRTGLFHRESNAGLEDRLMELRKQCDREKLVFAFHAACRELLTPPFRVAPVVYEDLGYWISQGLCPLPNRVVTESLFAGMPRAEH